MSMMTETATNQENKLLNNNLEQNSTLDADKEHEKYLSFLIAKQVYGISILDIKEIIEYMNVATIPMVPDYIRGVINLRGNIVPIIDLSARLETGSNEVGSRTCIVIVEVTCDEEVLNIGVVVDSVNEVLDIQKNDIEPAPTFGASIPVKYIAGMGRIGKEFMVLLNLDEVLDIEELSMFDGSEIESPQVVVENSSF